MPINERRNFDVKNISNSVDRFAVIVATFFGSGFFPIAPGTAGSLACIPLLWFLQPMSLVFKFVFWAIVFVVGVWAAQKFDHLMKTKDNQNIVIDEVLGMAIATALVHQSVLEWAIAFFCFRFFDALKPPPIKSFDKLAHTLKGQYGGGFGVIIDDIIAGLMALGVFSIVKFFLLV